MTLRATFRDTARGIAPPWLRGTVGGRFLHVIGSHIDAFVEAGVDAVKARFPRFAPYNALPHLGTDRRIRRGLAETAESYALRLKRWLTDHAVRGAPGALLGQLAGYLAPYTPTLRTIAALGLWDEPGVHYHFGTYSWDWDGSSDWARFWVVVYPRPGETLWQRGPKWGAPSAVWGDRSRTWGSMAKPDEVKATRSIVREWMPAGMTCAHIVIAYDAADFGWDALSGHRPDGQWANDGRLIDGRWQRARIDRALYWDGTTV